MPAAFTFLTANPIQLELNASGDLPKRIKLLGWGTTTGRNGNVYVLNASAAAMIAANQKAQGFEIVALDFEHNTVPTSPSYKGEPASIATRGPLEIVDGDGLYLNAGEWTEDGTKFIGGRHYTEVSPTLAVNERREVIFVHSAGAVRHGNIPDLTLYRNSAGPAELATLFSKLKTNSTDPMADTTAPDYKALLLQILGLAADATDDAITAAVKVEKAEPAGSEPETNAAKITGLETQVAELKTLIVGVQTNGATVERTALLAEASRQGKVVPKTALELNNVQLKALIAELPATVPVDQRTVETNSVVPGNVIEMNSVKAEVMQALGITEDRWKAQAGK